VGISIAGTPVYRKGFGLATMELPVLLSPSIRMRIHSTSKHFTCLCYLLLCEEGKAGIDDPIGKYMPELNRVSKGVTLRQLMGNVSGLRNPMNLRWELGSSEREIPIEELLDVYRTIDDVNFSPGVSWNYNNSGFELVAVAVERMTGQRLEEVLRSRIFEPVGMHDTLLRRVNSNFVPNSATMHMTSPSRALERTYLPGTIAGAGGIVSTVDDMLRWLKHMDAPIVGSAETWALMKTPQILANGTSTGYGFGLHIHRYRGVETVSHAGGGWGANSQMLKVPAAGLDIAMMLNRGDIFGMELTERVLDACLPYLDPIERRPERLFPVGLFRSPKSKLVIELKRSYIDSAIVKKDQPIASVNAMDYPVAFDHTGVLRPTGAIMDSTRYAIEPLGDRTQPGDIKFTDYGNVDTLEAAVRLDNADPTPIIGRYRCEGIGTVATVVAACESPRLNVIGPFGSAQCKLESLADGIWISTKIDISPTKSLLCFDNSGSFGYLSFSTKLSPLRFERIR
jgi:CubicO group peptidase (beta-lactamase class C family)